MMTNRRGSETILLAEDEPQVRKLAREMLEMSGYKVIEAETAGDALIIAEKQGDNISLLLTDVVMPIMSGKELADRVQKAKPKIKVLYMSGYTANVIAQEGILDGSTNFMQKPFTLSRIAKKVREALDRENYPLVILQ
jgi:two-component system, cell cycle sensor histidine kinase and response regulator CckA